jgi:hypothetical protein
MITIGMEIPDDVKRIMMFYNKRLFIRLCFSDDVKDIGNHKIVRVEYCDERGNILHVKADM